MNMVVKIRISSKESNDLTGNYIAMYNCIEKIRIGTMILVVDVEVY